MFKFRLIALFAGIIWVLTLNTAMAERVALVIGNSDYTQVPRLNNPYNDASDVAAALETIGFEVELAKNQSYDEMRRTLEAFQRRALRADVSLVYYAGHGLEVGKDNYLIPVDARLESDRAVRFEAIALDDMVYAAEGARRLSVVIVDACRDNPFRTRMQRQDPTRSLGRGLALFEPSPNSIVAYAARSGSVAYDGDGRNSPYAEALLDALREPGLEVGLMFRKIRDSVLTKTNQQQEPWMYGTLSQDLVYLNPPEVVAEAPTDALLSDETPGAARPLFPDASPDLQFWLAIRDSADAAELEEFLEIYPESDFAILARSRLARLEPPASAPPTTDAVALPPSADVDLPPVERSISIVDLSRDEARDLQARLDILGYSPGGADGVIGPNTRRAISAYQDDKGQEGDGQVTDVMLATLNEDVPETRVNEYFAGIAAAAAAEQARRNAAAAERARRAAAAARAQPTAPRQATPAAPAPAPAAEQESGSGWWPFGGHEPRGEDSPFGDGGKNGVDSMFGG